jgi:hypothetical protein
MSTFIEFEGGLVIETDNPEFHPEGKRLTRKAGQQKRREYCRAQLLKILKPGDTVYTVLRHVSASGMSRRIDLYTIKDGRMQYLSGYAAGLMDRKLSDKPGIVVGGCGMDMGFHLVYCLSYSLFKDSPPEGHRDGGYALRHEWI